MNASFAFVRATNSPDVVHVILLVGLPAEVKVQHRIFCFWDTTDFAMC